MKKTCLGCNKEYETNYIQSKFCSKSCRLTPCIVCGALYDNPGRNRKTCSYKCKGVVQKEQFVGEKNPNFGKKWSEAQRNNQSVLIKTKVDDNYRYKAGTANRGVKFSEDRIKKMHSNRDFDSYSRPKTEKTKIKIGIKSKQKFTEEYNRNFRKTMEENGRWIPLKNKSDKEVYYKESNWIDVMFDIVENGLTLLHEHGIYNSTSNKNGVVRDHIVGRKFGYINGVFPEILRHPANCNIISHKENISKGQRGKGREDADISLEELFDRIANYKLEWKEHERVLELIGEYKNGKRWKRKEVY